METQPAFTVGITGHMNLPEAAKEPVSHAIRQVFEWLGGKPAPGEMGKVLGPPLGLKETPVVLLSPLAPGADQLAARAAWDLGIKVKCPLPFPREIYRQSTTFRDAAGGIDPSRQAAFDAMIDEAGPENVFVVRHASDNVANGSWPVDDAEFRNLRYRAAGEFVARHCDLLIAVCNQETRSDVPDRDSRLSSLAESGSRVITASYLNGLRPGILPLPVSLSWQECGPLVRVYCPNLKEPHVTSSLQPGSVAIWHPADPGDDAEASREIHQREMGELRTQVENLEKINRDLRRSRQKKEGPANSGSDGLASLDATRADIDRVARRNHSISLGFTKLTFVAGLILFLSVSMVERGRAGYLLVIAAITIVAFLIQTVIRTRFNFYRKSEDYRALAGALEVQSHWARAGIQESAAFNYLQRLRGDISWILSALDSLTLPVENLAKSYQNLKTPSEKLAAFREVWSRWVLDDLRKHARLAFSKTRDKLCFNFLGYGFLVAGAAVMMLVLGLYWSVTRGAIGSALASHGFSQWKIWAGAAVFIYGLLWARDRRVARRLEERKLSSTIEPDSLSLGILRSIWAQVFFGLALGFFIYSCIYVETRPRFPDHLSAAHQKWTALARSLCFAMGGLWIGYGVTTLVSEDAKRHADMRNLFDSASRKLDFMLRQYENMIAENRPASDLAQMEESIQAVFKALGCEALYEQAECLLLRRGRPVKAVANLRS